MKLELHVHIHADNRDIMTHHKILAAVERIEMKQQEQLDILNALNDATNTIGVNVSTVATNVVAIGTAAVTISQEMDALLTQSANDVPAPVASALSGLRDRIAALAPQAQSVAEQAAAQVPVLEAIASKGASNPIPISPVELPAAV